MWLGGGDQHRAPDENDTIQDDGEGIVANLSGGEPEITDGHVDPIAEFDDAAVDYEDLHRAAHESDAMGETRCGCTLHGTRCLESA